MLEQNKISFQKNHPRYVYAEEFLEKVLLREKIDMSLLGRLQPENPELYRLVSGWRYDPELSNKPLREERETSGILAKTRDKIDKNPTMQKIEGYLTSNISRAAEGKNVLEIALLTVEKNIRLMSKDVRKNVLIKI